MKFILERFGRFLLPAVLLLAAACVDEIDRPGRQDGLISFAVTDGISAKGRSAVASNLAQLYGNSGNVAVSAKCNGSDYFAAGEYLVAGESFWTTGGRYYWPEDESLAIDFWSWAPKELPDGCGSLGLSDILGQNLSFSYEMPQPSSAHDDAVRQYDIIFGSRLSVTASSSSGVVDLAYRHALSEVKINVAKSNGGVLRSVSLENVKSRGDCVFNPEASPAFAWSNLSGKVNFTQDFDKTIAENLDGSACQHVSGGQEGETDGTIFMLIPQSCQDVRLKVVYRMEGKDEDETFETDLSGGTWVAGKSYTYNLNLLGGLGILVDMVEHEAAVTNLEIRNIGKETCYLRAIVVGNIVDDEGNIIAPWNSAAHIGQGLSGWENYWHYDALEDIYYYRYPLAPGQQPLVKLFETIESPAHIDGTSFVVSTIVQAVKSDGSTSLAEAAWGDVLSGYLFTE